MIWEVRPSPYGGVQIAALNILKHLSKRHSIRLIYCDEGFEAAKDFPELEPYCSQVDSVATPWLSPSAQLLTIARNSLDARKLLSLYRCFFTSRYSPVMAETTRQAFNDDKYDVIYASNQVACYARRLSAHKVVHAFDCVSAACRKEYETAQRAGMKAYWLLAYLKNRCAERKILETFDDCIVVSNEEYDAFKALVPSARCSVIGLGVDTEFFRPTQLNEEWPSLIFVGYMSHSPNVSAILYFHLQVYNALKKRFPNLKLVIVGQNPAEPIRALANDPSIILTGFVEDVRPYIARASVAIAPFVSGTGTKTKVMEAMAMEKPVVTTQIGAQGINATDCDHFYIADSPAAFANRVEELLLDDIKRKRMGRRAREFVEREHSWAHVTEDIGKVLSNSEI